VSWPPAFYWQHVPRRWLEGQPGLETILECFARFRLVEKEDADEALTVLRKEGNSPFPPCH